MPATFTPVGRTAPTMTTKVLSPDQVLSNRIQIEMQDKIHMYLPQATPLLTITNRLRESEVTENRKFEMLTKDMMPRATTLSANSATGSTTIVLGSGEGARIGSNYLLRNKRTGTIVLVPTAPAVDTLTVVRPFGTLDADMLATDKLVFIGTAFMDGSTKGSFRGVKETNDYNYAQIFRTAYGFTGRALNTRMYGGKIQMTERQWQSIEHKRSIEYSMVFGGRFLYSGGTETRTSMGGILSFISSNVWDLGGAAITEDNFEMYLETVLREGDGGYLNGTGTKYLLHSARLGTYINRFAREKLQYRPLDKTIGFVGKEYQGIHGKLILLHAPMFDEHAPDLGLVLDFNHITARPFINRNTKLIKNIQDPSADAQEEEWFTDMGIQVDLEAAHGVIMGFPV